MGVLNVGSNGVSVNGSDIANFFFPAADATDSLAANPAYSIQLNNIGYILAIVAGALFALGAIIALFNLIRDKYGIHLFIILFGLERVATYVIRALLYKKPRQVYVEVFEILEAAGTFIIIVILYHLWAGTARVRLDGTRKRGRCCHCCVLTLATIAIFLGVDLFIAGAVLQDRASATVRQYNDGFKLRKAAVIVYGAVLGIFDLLALGLFFRKGARRGALGLLICGALLSAKAGFQIYAIWHRPDRYYENKFFWPLFVLTELLVLLILVFPGYVRRCLRPIPALPITDVNGQYVVGGGAAPAAQPYAPAYQGPAVGPNYK